MQTGHPLIGSRKRQKKGTEITFSPLFSIGEIWFLKSFYVGCRRAFFAFFDIKAYALTFG
jgi:hypothetical protein